MTKEQLVPGFEEAVKEALERTGTTESPPDWQKIPDCPCFRAMPETRGERTDMAVHAMREVIEMSLNDSGVCDAAAFTFLGALLVSATGVAFQTRFQAPGRESATLFDMTDDE